MANVKSSIEAHAGLLRRRPRIGRAGGKKLFRRFLYVPKHLAQHVSPDDGTEVSAVDAILVSPKNVDLIFVPCNPLNFFYHRAVCLVPEGDDVSLPDLPKKKGDLGHKHKIPILIRREQAIACYLNNTEHHRSG